MQELNVHFSSDFSEVGSCNPLKLSKRSFKGTEESHISFKSKTNLTVAQLLEQVEIAKNNIPPSAHQKADDGAFPSRYMESVKAHPRPVSTSSQLSQNKSQNLPNSVAKSKLDPLPMAITSPSYPLNLTESVQKAMGVVDFQHSPLNSPEPHSSNLHNISSYLKNNQWPAKGGWSGSGCEQEMPSTSQGYKEQQEGMKVYSEEDMHEMVQRGSDHNTTASTNSNNSTLSVVEADINFCLNADDENHLDSIIALKDYDDIEKLAEALASNINDGNLDDMLMNDDLFNEEQLHQTNFQNNLKHSNSAPQSSVIKDNRSNRCMQNDYEDKLRFEDHSSKESEDRQMSSPFKNGNHVSDSQIKKEEEAIVGGKDEAVKKMRRRGGKKESTGKAYSEGVNGPSTTRMSTRSSNKTKSLPSSSSSNVQSSSSETGVDVSSGESSKEATCTISTLTPRRSTRTIKKTEIALESSATKASERQKKLLKEQATKEVGQEGKHKTAHAAMPLKTDAKAPKTRCINNKKPFNKSIQNLDETEQVKKGNTDKKVDVTVNEPTSDSTNNSGG